MKKLALAPVLALAALLGCSAPSASHTSQRPVTPLNLGKVELADSAQNRYPLDGGRECWVRLNALANHQVLVKVVITRSLAQGQMKVLARPYGVLASPGQPITIDLGEEGSVTLTPSVKLAANL